MAAKHGFHVIDGTPPPSNPKEELKRRLRNRPKPAELLQCQVCGGRELTPAYTGMTQKNGKAQGGTKQWLCTMCMAGGRRVVVSPR